MNKCRYNIYNNYYNMKQNECFCFDDECKFCLKKKIKKLEDQVKKYKDISKKFVELNLDMSDQDNSDEFDDSVDDIIFEKNETGTLFKTFSNDNDQFIVIEDDDCLSRNELDKKSKAAIKKQDFYARYNKSAQYLEKASSIYGIAGSIICYGKYALGFVF